MPLLPQFAAGEWTRRGRSMALAAALAGSLAACQTTESAPPAPIIGARLSPVGGSTMTGAISFWEFDGGIGMGVEIANVRTGPWRVVIHANGNCSSPNGFSAGPPLEVPGVASPIVVNVTTGDFLMGSATVRLRGLAINGPNGIFGKSVVVHSGVIGPLDAEPGVPNNRYACGVIERLRPLF